MSQLPPPKESLWEKNVQENRVHRYQLLAGR